MKSAEASSWLRAWLDSFEAEFHLAIDDGEVVLQRADGGVLCKAALSLSWRGEAGLLETVLRLSSPSLRFFAERAAALSMNPADGRFWLSSWVSGDSQVSLERRLEENLDSLLNQRDSWNELLKRHTPRTVAFVQPLPIGPFRQGRAYA